MDEFGKLCEALHDAVITEIRHDVRHPRVTLLLGDGRRLECGKVVIFRSESYFNRLALSVNTLYIGVATISRSTWLIDAALSQYKPDGAKKWGDDDIRNWGMLRTDPLVHINLYCNDWEFDVVCQEVNLL